MFIEFEEFKPDQSKNSSFKLSFKEELNGKL
jgi:hypothetical protein